MQGHFNISMSDYVLYNRLKRSKIYGIKKTLSTYRVYIKKMQSAL